MAVKRDVRHIKGPSAEGIAKALHAAANPAHAAILGRFFKTGPGEYGEGDRFIGLKVPVVRRIVRQFRDVSMDDAMALVVSPVHELRLAALLLMVQHARQANSAERNRIRRLYLLQSRHINNWDLVDLSAPQIVGESLSPDNIALLRRLARSRDVWERRIATMATFAFIRRNRFEPTLEICEMLLEDGHDLIHKACGWMLREVGKRDPQSLRSFLAKHAATMPRTMLRYSIERVDEAERRTYLVMRSANLRQQDA